MASALAAKEQPGPARDYAARAVALLQEAVKVVYANYRGMQTDPDLEAVRSHPGFVALLGPGHLDRRYAAVWHSNAERQSEEVHGLDSAQHLQRCRDWARQGWRPVALSVAWLAPERPLVTASVWHRPVVSEQARDALARRQAQAAVALLHLNQGERVWPLLKHSPDPRLRTLIIHRLSPLGAEPRELIARLREEGEVSIRRALLLCLGEFTAEQLPAAERQALVPDLLRTYRTDPDPGIHGAAEWLLRRWGQAAELRKIDQELAKVVPEQQRKEGERHWYVSREGHTMVLIPGPVEFWMGSPAQEPDRIAQMEPLHRTQIPRSFALATKEVTVAQFLRFRPNHPYMKKYSPELDGPIVNVTWYDAAAYCNWLSDQEGIPKEEWCYPEQIGPNMRMPTAYLGKKGYRLPTEAEWEYACRAEAVTSRHYGVQDDALLGNYAWFLGNSRDHAWPVGLLKPNDFGLFDMHGNAWEWCQERAQLYRWKHGEAVKDKEDILYVSDTQSRLLRSAAFLTPASNVRSAQRNTNRPSLVYYTAGLRVARTYP